VVEVLLLAVSVDDVVDVVVGVPVVLVVTRTVVVVGVPAVVLVVGGWVSVVVDAGGEVVVVLVVTTTVVVVGAPPVVVVVGGWVTVVVDAEGVVVVVEVVLVVGKVVVVVVQPGIGVCEQEPSAGAQASVVHGFMSSQVRTKVVSHWPVTVLHCSRVHWL